MYFTITLRPNAARAFVHRANLWLASNARRPGLAAERFTGHMEHFITLTRRPGQADGRPRCPLPACWPARFALLARRFLCAARLQPAGKAGQAREPAVELWAACTTAHGLLQLATLARDCGLQVQGRCAFAASLCVRLTDAPTFEATVQAVHIAIEDIAGPAHCTRADGAAHWRFPATDAEAIDTALRAPDMWRRLQHQRAELPDLRKAARGPV